MSQDLHPTIAAWVAADRGLELSEMYAQLSPGAILVSPLTDGFVFSGADEVIKVFESAFELLDDIKIKAVTGSADDWVIHGTNMLNGNNLEEIQWLHLNAEGRIDHITLFIRPVAAAVDLLARIGPPMQRRGLFGVPGGAASRSAFPLAAALRLVENRVMPQLRNTKSRP